MLQRFGFEKQACDSGGSAVSSVSSLCFFRGQRTVGHSGLHLINAHTRRACVGSKQRLFVWTD